MLGVAWSCISDSQCRLQSERPYIAAVLMKLKLLLLLVSIVAIAKGQGKVCMTTWCVDFSFIVETPPHNGVGAWSRCMG